MMIQRDYTEEMSPYKSSTTDGMALARLTWMRILLRAVAVSCGLLRYFAVSAVSVGPCFTDQQRHHE